MASFLNRDAKSLVNHNIKKDCKLLLHISMYINLNILFFFPVQGLSLEWGQPTDILLINHTY